MPSIYHSYLSRPGGYNHCFCEHIYLAEVDTCHIDRIDDDGGNSFLDYKEHSWPMKSITDMNTNTKNNDKQHNAPVTENLSLSIIGGGALGALAALVGLVSGLIVESSVSILIIAAGGIVGGLVSLLVSHQSGKKASLEPAPESIEVKELPSVDSIDQGSLESEAFPTEESAAALQAKILEISEWIQSRSSKNAASSIDNSEDSPSGFNSINQSHFDEMITKLELARVYVDMEDMENARMLFDEVLEETEELKVGKATNRKASDQK